MATKSIVASGRHSGRKRGREITGRPPIPKIDKIAATAWFYELKRLTKATSASEVAKKVNEDPESKRFNKYERGEVTPSYTTLKNIDTHLFSIYRIPAVRGVFDDGPEGVRLWDALAGNCENLWDIIDAECPAISLLRVARNRHESRVDAFINSAFNGNPKIPFELHQLTDAAQPNFVDTLYTLDKVNNAAIQAEHVAVYNIQEIILKEEQQIARLRDVEDQRQKEIDKSLPRDVNSLFNGDSESRLGEAELTQREMVKTELLRRTHYINEILRPMLDDKRTQLIQASANTPELNIAKFNTLTPAPIMKCSFKQLAATIALWRISMLVADSFEKMDDIINGLKIHAIPDMLRPYGVDKKVIEMIKEMQAEHYKWLKPSKKKD